MATGGCHKCSRNDGQLVCYGEDDKRKLSVLDNTGRVPVYLCSACMTVGDRWCDHCDGEGRTLCEPLFDRALPLEQRPPVWRFNGGRWLELVSPQCVEEVEQAVARGQQCSVCFGYRWQSDEFDWLTFTRDHVSGELVCDECVRGRLVARCAHCKEPGHSGWMESCGAEYYCPACTGYMGGRHDD